jgi:hypothetical protein
MLDQGKHVVQYLSYDLCLVWVLVEQVLVLIVLVASSEIVNDSQCHLHRNIV